MKLNQLIQRIAIQRQEEFPFPENLETYLEDFIPNTLLKSETLQRAFAVSPYEMEEIYKEGHSFYILDNFLESSTSFRWLVLLNPFVAKYWMGLAASLQLLEKYEKALHAYAMVALLEMENPYPHWHAYECYSLLNNLEEGKLALQNAYQRTLNQPAYCDLKQVIETLREAPCHR